MAARANLDKPERPLLAHDRFNIPVNTEVEVTTSEGYVIKGNCYQNPSKTHTTDAVELVNCRRYDPRTGETSAAGFQRFFRDNILKLLTFQEKRVIDPERDIPERIIATKIIATEEELEQLFVALECEKVIGLSVQGINVSRDGTLGWICIYARGVLICIDVLKMNNSDSFWNTIETKLFMNPMLLKVVHDIRPLVDYLYHKKAMKTRNLYCTQLSELYIRSHLNFREMPADVGEKRRKDTDYNWEAKPLSYCLEKFIPNSVYFSELPLLKQFETQDFSVRNPLMNRPLKNDVNTKAVAIATKYLLELYEAQMKILMSHYSQVIQEQTKLMMRGSMSDHYKHITDPSQVAHNVMEMIVAGKPYLVPEMDGF